MGTNVDKSMDMSRPEDKWIANAGPNELDLIGAVARSAVSWYAAQMDRGPSAFGETRAAERELMRAVQTLNEYRQLAENRRIAEDLDRMRALRTHR